jgi:DinB family protein
VAKADEGGISVSDPQSKAEIVEQLQQVRRGLSETVEQMPAEQFYRGTAEAWSACDYLQHLLLSNKPFAKGLTLPCAEIKKLFGEPSRPSMSYAGLVAKYHGRLDDGIRAEDYQPVTPVSFRMPEEITDVQAYLLKSWTETHEKMYGGLAHWSESDLDTNQLMHPAMGLITVREMLFFTIYHNTLHWNDIQAAFLG